MGQALWCGLTSGHLGRGYGARKGGGDWRSHTPQRGEVDSGSQRLPGPYGWQMFVWFNKSCDSGKSYTTLLSTLQLSSLCKDTSYKSSLSKTQAKAPPWITKPLINNATWICKLVVVHYTVLVFVLAGLIAAFPRRDRVGFFSEGSAVQLSVVALLLLMLLMIPTKRNKNWSQGEVLSPDCSLFPRDSTTGTCLR